MTVVQHILGLAGTALVYLAWRSMRPEGATMSGFPSMTHRVVGVLITHLCCSATAPISFEHSVMTEGVHGFLLTASVLVGCLYLKRLCHTGMDLATAVLGAALLVANGITFYVRPLFGVGLVLCSLPVLVSCFLTGSPWKLRAAQLAVGGVLILVLFTLPQAHCQAKDPMSRLFLPETLFCWHADLAHREIVSDLEGRANAPYERQLLVAVRDALEKEWERARREGPGYPVLGFNPDGLTGTPAGFRPAQTDLA